MCQKPPSVQRSGVYLTLVALNIIHVSVVPNIGRRTCMVAICFQCANVPA